MKRLLGFQSCLVGGAAVLALSAQPVSAAATVITGVRVVSTDDGVRITLRTESGDTPQVFAVNQGNSLRADIVRTQLNLPDGDQFVQQDPAPGIESISLVPLDANSVRLTVNGSNRVPSGTISDAENGILIDITTNTSGNAQASTPVPSELETLPGDDTVAQAEPEATETTPEDAPAETETPTQTQEQPDVLVPEPQVTIEGEPAVPPQGQQAPPFLPRAVAPPVGDIAIAESTPGFSTEVDLGTAERVPRLVLRNAPSREVLTLLARAAGLNLVFLGEAGGEDGEGGGGGSGEGPSVTLDIENESVQAVFNSVLRITGLEASRVGRIVYVSPNLPTSVENVSIRTLRMNQVDATVAANFLVALGAESSVSRERLVTNVNAVEVGEGVAPVTETQTSTVENIENQRVDYEDSEPILRGLVVVADERTNSVTLVGQPQLIELATQQLVRIDLRRRQVAINVRVIDVDLNALDASGTSFSFSSGDADFVQSGGVGVINFGEGSAAPADAGGVPSAAPINPLNIVGNAAFSIAEDFIAQLFNTVQDGHAKILTDPTLIVREGQTASVALTEDVVTEITTEVETTEVGQTRSTEFEIEPAGLVLQIDVDRIDDNGFVSLSVAPSISAPSQTFDTGTDAGSFTLLSRRSLNSGQIRVRDGQTLILSGIIRETDRTSVTKVPILGDIPILGSLFRSTVRENSRNEVIVLLTPQVLDDSDQSAYGYRYTPSEEVQELINRSNN